MEIKFKARQMKVGHFWPSDGTMSLILEFAIADVGEMTLAELERFCKAKCRTTITEAADEK